MVRANNFRAKESLHEGGQLSSGIPFMSGDLQKRREPRVKSPPESRISARGHGRARPASRAEVFAQRSRQELRWSAARLRLSGRLCLVSSRPGCDTPFRSCQVDAAQEQVGDAKLHA